MPIPRDYRDYPEPRLWSYEILIALKNKKMDFFTSSDVAKIFNLSQAEACTRINVMKRYG